MRIKLFGCLELCNYGTLRIFRTFIIQLTYIYIYCHFFLTPILFVGLIFKEKLYLFREAIDPAHRLGL